MLFARFFLGAVFLGDDDGAFNDVLATSPSAMFSFPSTCAIVDGVVAKCGVSSGAVRDESKQGKGPTQTTTLAPHILATRGARTSLSLFDVVEFENMPDIAFSITTIFLYSCSVLGVRNANLARIQNILLYTFP